MYRGPASQIGMPCVALMLSLLTTLACGGLDKDSATSSERASPTSITLVSSALISAREGRLRTPKEINDGNPMGWVGRAHNRFLTQFLADWRRSPGDVCGTARKLYNSNRWLGEDSARFSASARAAQMRMFAQAWRCSVREVSDDGTDASSSIGVPVSLERTIRSGDVQPYLDAMSASVDSVSTATEYAAVVDAILDDAELVLTGDELVQAQTAASIAVSSGDYWETNVMAEYALVEPTFENCTYIAEEPYPCQEDAVFRSRTNSRGVPLVLVSNTARAFDCSDYLNWKKFAASDLAGGLLGLIVTLNPAGALAAALSGSAHAGVVFMFSYFICMIT